MSATPAEERTTIARRVEAEVIDDFDEELEMEIDDGRMERLVDEIAKEPDGGEAPKGIDRRLYFRELFRLQGELVKLQDWVIAQKAKVVVLFEGRDAAGKGGSIKRI